MHLLRQKVHIEDRSQKFNIVPLGDIHLGAKACNEKKFQEAVTRIAADPDTYWIGMGDYCDFINLKDKRFSPGTLPSWIQVPDLADLARAERDRFLAMIEPIAGKCLGLVRGNHELAIEKHYERGIYLDIVNGIKDLGGYGPGHSLAIGYVGFLRLSFIRGKASRTYDVFLHHGFGGGKLAGGKALNLQRLQMFAPAADLLMMGHTHDVQVMPLGGYKVSGSRIERFKRYAIRTGTFLESSNLDGPDTYPDMAGYIPGATSYTEVRIVPHSEDPDKRINVITY